MKKNQFYYFQNASGELIFARTNFSEKLRKTNILRELDLVIFNRKELYLLTYFPCEIIKCFQGYPGTNKGN